MRPGDPLPKSATLKSKRTERPATESPATAPAKAAAQQQTTNYPTVAIGASAGGVEAITELLRNLSENPGAAFICVLHQDPRHESMLPEVLRRVTTLPIEHVADGMSIEPNRFYLAPPGTEVTVVRGTLHVVARKSGIPMPVDTLFRSVAEDEGNRAIGIVLSGTGSDGALGAKAIKGEGGITFAQDESARFDGMPRSASAAGAIDFVLPPVEVARELARIVRHSYVAGGDSAYRLAEPEVLKIFALLEASHDVDFTSYKPSTMERRIRRRMALHKLEDVTQYVTMLRESGAELKALHDDILIRVTSFFRDPQVFDALKSNLFGPLMQDRQTDAPVRVWVPGCATGEEAYSLAIALLEMAGDADNHFPIQIFGSDVSPDAIDYARTGLYPESIAADVSPERLGRFFSKVEGGYRVSRSVRDCCVFARQNLTRDPWFSRLDLISCRNVMIYLGSVLQRKVISVFHYALRPNGYLLLGSSETIGNFGELFGVVDRRHKIYQKRAGVAGAAVDLRPANSTMRVERSEPRGNEEAAGAPASLFREADRLLLSRYVPAGVLVNDALDILQFRGRTSAYLEPAPGTASLNVLKMAREGLLAELRAAIHAARKLEEPVRREGVQLPNNGTSMKVNLDVVPFAGAAKERYFLILFETVSETADDAKPKRRSRKRADADASASEIMRLERELEASREYLQSIIEEQEAMNEELRSANEEIQSSNEELQSTNEELEMAKEELQSSNEELTTLNEELENRNDELAEVNNDLVNLLGSVDIPIVMLDADLRIRRFNPGAQRTLNLIPNDVGRTITDLKMTLQLDNLEQLITDVIDKLAVKELDVQDRVGHWYSLRIRPCRTTENKIEGAVLVLVDIDELKQRP